MLCATLLFYDKLSSLEPSDISAPSVRHVQNIRFSSIRRDPEYAFPPLSIFLHPPVGSDPDDHTAIYSSSCQLARFVRGTLSVIGLVRSPSDLFLLFAVTVIP
jgi:hypothetical protein